MKLIERKDVKKKALPGRMIQLLVGQDDAVSLSNVMTMGFARYSAESGPMDPHHHVEEIVYILSAKDGWTRHGGFGEQPNALGEDKVILEAGMTLHFPDNEWHVFEFNEGGHVEIIFFYSQADVYSSK
ncbi:MAG: hypothetical protein QGM50_10580 [Anaerolineae bacterium]|nr:hypothetical protein [Anaerolineae bacterium]